jgi:hypothetical protein
MSDQDPGQGAPVFPFSPQDALAFLQKMWNPLGVPMPGFGLPGTPAAGGAPGMQFPNPASMFAALDPAEVERKIGELRVIENWLAMSLDMMRMSIKTLELQKASLEALTVAPRPASPGMPGETPPPSRPRRKS